MKIILKPIGDMDKSLVEELEQKLQQTFGCPVGTVIDNFDLEKAYDKRQKQYRGIKLLPQLKKDKAKGDKVLGIVDVDLYSPGLNFIFGQADIAAGTSVISLIRLRQEYYGLAPDESLFRERAVKEAVHELGHTLGLDHCDDAGCVMRFSNALSDTDRKQAAFCGRCRPKLLK
jgi:archaemetzincin